MENVRISPKKKYKTGSLLGLVIVLAMGFGLYFLLENIRISGNWFNYDTIVSNAANNLFYKFVWFIMNFTEANYYTGFFASIGLISGGFIAWRLEKMGSSKAGIPLCYGDNEWPWIFAAQVLSLFIVVFILDYTIYFNKGYTWIPTFITVVGIPPAAMLLYGPNPKALLTCSILGAIICFPTAFWILNNIIPVLDVPGVIANTLTMALTGIIVCSILKVLPWIRKIPRKPTAREERSEKEIIREMEKPSWFVRRVIADFSEAPFYGNEIVGILVLIGVIIDWLLNTNHVAQGSGALPTIILSQFIGSGVGVFLYFDKFVEKGWYATYVPVVGVGPACVLFFQPTVKVAIVAGVLGGIIGGPLAEFFVDRLPEDYAPTIGNVTGIALATTIVAMTIKYLFGF